MIDVLQPCDNISFRRLLESKLRDGIVTFCYKKKSTSEARIARGTTNPNYFSYAYKGSLRKSNSNIIRYWDIDKEAWRSLDFRNILNIV